MDRYTLNKSCSCLATSVRRSRRSVDRWKCRVVVLSAMWFLSLHLFRTHKKKRQIVSINLHTKNSLTFRPYLGDRIHTDSSASAVDKVAAVAAVCIEALVALDSCCTRFVAAELLALEAVACSWCQVDFPIDKCSLACHSRWSRAADWRMDWAGAAEAAAVVVAGSSDDKLAADSRIWWEGNYKKEKRISHNEKLQARQPEVSVEPHPRPGMNMYGCGGSRM